MILTWNEIENGLKVEHLESKMYNRIERNIYKAYGYGSLSDRIMKKIAERTIREVLNCSMADLLDGIEII